MSDNIMGYIDVVFDGPPDHRGGRFVEVENEQGHSISAGNWIKWVKPNDDEYWRLRIHTDRGINSIAKEMHAIATASGFHSGDAKKTPLEEVALWHSECSEAAEEIRDGVPLDLVHYKVKMSPDRALTEAEHIVVQKIYDAQRRIDADGEKADVADLMPSDEEWLVLVEGGIAKPEGYGIEAADVVIRIMDSLVDKGIDLAKMIHMKAAYNRTREHLHGRVK